MQEDYLPKKILASHFAPRHELINKSIEHVTLDGLFLEFGVFRGDTLRAIRHAMATRGINKPVYGFDSFQGLPEKWHVLEAGCFRLDQPPTFDDPNITIVKGMFQDTVDLFLLHHVGPIAFANIDCDLYSSSKCVFQALAPRIIEGTVLLFDELIGYPDFLNHEYKVWIEHMNEHNCDVDVLWHGPQQVALKVTKNLIYNKMFL